MTRSFSFTQPFLVIIVLLYGGLGVVLLLDEEWLSASFFLTIGVFCIGRSLYLLRKKRIARRAYHALPRERYDPEKHGPWLTSSSW